MSSNVSNEFSPPDMLHDAHTRDRKKKKRKKKPSFDEALDNVSQHVTRTIAQLHPPHLMQLHQVVITSTCSEAITDTLHAVAITLDAPNAKEWVGVENLLRDPENLVEELIAFDKEKMSPQAKLRLHKHLKSKELTITDDDIDLGTQAIEQLHEIATGIDQYHTMKRHRKKKLQLRALRHAAEGKSDTDIDKVRKKKKRHKRPSDLSKRASAPPDLGMGSISEKVSDQYHNQSTPSSTSSFSSSTNRVGNTTTVNNNNNNTKSDKGNYPPSPVPTPKSMQKQLIATPARPPQSLATSWAVLTNTSDQTSVKSSSGNATSTEQSQSTCSDSDSPSTSQTANGTGGKEVSQVNNVPPPPSTSSMEPPTDDAYDTVVTTDYSEDVSDDQSPSDGDIGHNTTYPILSLEGGESSSSQNNTKMNKINHLHPPSVMSKSSAEGADSVSSFDSPRSHGSSVGRQSIGSSRRRNEHTKNTYPKILMKTASTRHKKHPPRPKGILKQVTNLQLDQRYTKRHHSHSSKRRVDFGDVSTVRYWKDEDITRKYNIFWGAIQAKMKEAYRQQKRFQQSIDNTEWWWDWKEDYDDEEEKLVASRVWDFVFELPPDKAAKQQKRAAIQRERSLISEAFSDKASVASSWANESMDSFNSSDQHTGTSHGSADKSTKKT